MEATVAVIIAARPDIIALQDFDFDAGGVALDALADALADQGAAYPHRLALRPNTGRPTGFDLDGNGRTNEARDAHGYGRFNGAGGMALLSRYPIGDVRDFAEVLWRDLPDNSSAEVTSADALEVLRLHTVSAWDVEVLTPNGSLHILTSHANTPVFDGPEDRNGLRNADEQRFWQLYLNGWSPDAQPFTAETFAYMGTLNVDPSGGEGRQDALRGLLDHPAVQDPLPDSPTTDWEEPSPGDMRVDYILPSQTLRVLDAGIVWPEDGPLLEAVEAASDHRLIWVDVAF